MNRVSLIDKECTWRHPSNTIMIRARQQCGAKYQMNSSTFTLETCPKCPSLVCILNETVRAPAANELLGTRTVVVSCFLAYSLYLTYISIRLHDTQSGRGNVPLKLRGGPHSRCHLEILKLKILTAVHFTDMLCRLVRHLVFVSVFWRLVVLSVARISQFSQF